MPKRRPADLRAARNNIATSVSMEKDPITPDIEDYQTLTTLEKIHQLVKIAAGAQEEAAELMMELP